MALTRKFLIVFGVILMLAGLLSAVTAMFYEFKVKPEMIKRGQMAAPNVPKSAKGAQARPEGIGIEALMNQSKGLYGADESARREGTLWVDQAGGKLVVNLGAVNGLKTDDGLAVYDHDLKIGHARTADVFDVVAYVEMDETFKGSMDKNYYRVEKDQTEAVDPSSATGSR